MIFYVIGNGFDLHYGLQTTYQNFKEYLTKNRQIEIVKKIDELFKFHDYNPEEIKLWSRFEDMLKVFNRLFVDDLYEEGICNAEQDDERADFTDSPAWTIDYYNEYIDILKSEFVSWISSFDTKIIKDNYFIPRKKDLILTFNYTSTIEDNFKDRFSEILHIHGKTGEDLVLGHNEYEKPDLFNIVWDEYCDIRTTRAEEAANKVVENASTLYFKNSEKIIDDNSFFFSKIKDCEEIRFLGLSCGDQDHRYIYEIVNYAKSIIFYYYSDDDKQRFSELLVNKDINVNYVKW